MPIAPPALSDPEWLGHRYVESADAYRLVRLPRAERSRVPFLTDDCIGPRDSLPDIPAQDCLSALPKQRIGWLFHSAFCASTLMTHGFDVPGLVSSLSEPVVLNDMAGFRRRGATTPALARACDGAMRLLGRAFHREAGVVVKPSNVVNPIANLLLALNPESTALFLYSPLPTFLIAVVRRGLACRIWVRELLDGFLADGYVALGFEPQDYFRLTDLQVAAVGWLAQHHHFAQLCALHGPGRLRMLDADSFVAMPENALAAVVSHWGLPNDPESVARIATGPAFARHSKSGTGYSPEKRAADHAAAHAAHGEEINSVLRWAEQVAAGVGISLAASNPLLG